MDYLIGGLVSCTTFAITAFVVLMVLRYIAQRDIENGTANASGIDKDNSQNLEILTSIKIRILVAYFSGVLISCLASLSFIFALNHIFSTQWTNKPVKAYFLSWVIGLGFFPAGIVITLPLLALALVCGKFFKGSIERHTALWCLLAPAMTWCLTIGAFYLTSEKRYEFGFWHYAAYLTKDGEGAFLAVGLLASAITFYIFSRTAGRRWLQKWMKKLAMPCPPAD